MLAGLRLADRVGVSMGVSEFVGGMRNAESEVPQTALAHASRSRRPRLAGRYRSRSRAR
jgi:hypothetical protein